MKFDFVIGNPPYQEETEGVDKQAKNIKKTVKKTKATKNT